MTTPILTELGMQVLVAMSLPNVWYEPSELCEKMKQALPKVERELLILEDLDLVRSDGTARQLTTEGIVAKRTIRRVRMNKRVTWINRRKRKAKL